MSAKPVVMTPDSRPRALNVIGQQVTVLVDGRALLTEALSDGTAVVTLKPKRALKKTVTIAYSGDTRFRASLSPGALIVPVSLLTMTLPMAAFPGQKPGAQRGVVPGWPGGPPVARRSPRLPLR